MSNKSSYQKKHFVIRTQATILVAWVLLLSFSINSKGAALDLIPPEITIVSPLENTVTETNKPWIEVLIVDEGTGIQQESIRFYLDGVEITNQALIEETDVTGQAGIKRYRIRYQPKTPLLQGIHQIYFLVQDRAENQAEARWSFKVKAIAETKLQIGGTNTLLVEEYPIARTTDNYTVNIQGQFDETRFRYNFNGHMTNYPSGTPDFIYQGYNFYNGRYTLAINHRNLEVIWGSTTVPLDSELLQISPEVKGRLINYQVSNGKRTSKWSFFSGEASNSFGFNNFGYEFSGLTGEWQLSSRTGLKSFYVDMGGSDGYRYLGIKGDTVINDLLLLRMETVHGRNENMSGNSFAFHADRPLGSTYLGMDYSIMEPDYPDPADSFSLTPQGGIQKIGLHSNTPIGIDKSVSFYSLITEDNLDGKNNSTNYNGNNFLAYEYRPILGWGFKAKYQYNYGKTKKASNDTTKDVDKLVHIEVQRSFDSSTFKSHLILGESRNSVPTSSYEQVELFNAWTLRGQKYNFTPSLQLKRKDEADGTYITTNELRLTTDIRFHPNLNRSYLAVFYRTDSNYDTNKTDETIVRGWESSISLLFWTDSTLMLTFDKSFWKKNFEADSKGIDVTLRLSWQARF